MFTFLSKIFVLLIPVIGSVLPPAALAIVVTKNKDIEDASGQNRTIAFIASDLKNESVGILYREFKEATSLFGWKVKIRNGSGSPHRIKHMLEFEIRSGVDAIVLGGFQIDSYRSLAQEAKQRGVILVGWHSAATPGPQENLFANVATSAKQVAQLAFRYAVDNFQGRIGVVIINDSQFALANEKTRQLVLAFRSCATCEILAVEDIPISHALELMPARILKWNKEFGNRWTHIVAINDSYFDHVNIPLSEEKRRDIINISAGDGSLTALSRVRSGLSQHKAVVAEPIREQGWQITNELFYAFRGKSWSGRITNPVLISNKVNGLADGGSEKPYEQYFKNIWFGTEKK